MRNSKIRANASCHAHGLRRAAQGIALATAIAFAGLSQGAWAHAHVVSSAPAAQASVEAPTSCA
ncbi:hypothetical protein ACNHE5_04920 [Pandoraea pnomenusa]|uniref:hypothetical protein n=1 Tax=Pandoraea pnomenusa TaxID=93220 RepID=UPI003CE6709C